MHAADQTPASHPDHGALPHWSVLLRALREARAVTQDGWAARLGVGRATVQRWERGERVPDAAAEAAIIAYCRDAGLSRPGSYGRIGGGPLSPTLIEELLAYARWQAGSKPADQEHSAALAGRALPSRQISPRAPLPALALPAPLSSFVGREREIATVRRIQAGTRLLTLTGAGGCGKTRLALQIAGELRWAYPDGVVFVDLAPVLDPQIVAPVVATALGISTGSTLPASDDLIRALERRHVLLLLDNCEHLLPECAHLVEALLRACHHVAVLATSRASLEIDGETIWRVPGLALPGRSAGEADSDATRLFTERARLLRPEWEPSPDESEAIEAICRQLDGMPLAIELAAARVEVLSISQIAERLGDRFSLLKGRGATTVPRHQTLRAAMDWSYDLLSEQGRSLLNRLSVFAGGCTLAAAEAVCADGDTDGPAAIAPGEVLDLLAQLVDRSLVVAEHLDGTTRYRLLETVRQYARAQLVGADQEAGTLRRHASWCLTLAEAAERMATSPHEGEWLARLEREHDNLRSALAWSLAAGQPEADTALHLAATLHRFWDVRGHLSEGRRWLTRALAKGNQRDTPARAKALRAAATLAYDQGDFAAAAEYGEACRTLCQILEDAEGMAFAEVILGKIAFRHGDYPLARHLLESSLVRRRSLDEDPVVATAQANLGMIALRQGDYAAARTRLEASLRIHRAVGNKQGIASILDDLATLATEEGDYDGAESALQESLALFRAIGNPNGTAMALSSLGILAWQRGERDQASAMIEEGLSLYRETGDRDGAARLLGYQSIVALYEGRALHAEALSRTCLRLYYEAGNIWAIGRYLPVLGGSLFAQEQVERAVPLMAAAAAVRERLMAELPRAFRAAHDRTIMAMRTALGEARFDSAWSAGATAPLDGILADALGSGPER